MAKVNKLFNTLKKNEETTEAAAPEREERRPAAGGKRSVVSEYPVDSILPSKDNTASQLKDEKYLELMESIKENGILDPLKVIPSKDIPGKFELISGHRRFSIAKELGLATVPCLVMKAEESEVEKNALIFKHNQGKRNDDPFGSALAVKQHIKLSQALPKEDRVDYIEKFNLPKQSGTTKRLGKLAELDTDVLTYGQKGYLTQETALGILSSSLSKEGQDKAIAYIKQAAAKIEKEIAKLSDEEKSAKIALAAADIKTYITSLMKKPKGRPQKAEKKKDALESFRKAKKAIIAITDADLDVNGAKKEQLKELLEGIKDECDKKLKKLN